MLFFIIGSFYILYKKSIVSPNYIYFMSLIIGHIGKGLFILQQPIWPHRDSQSAPPLTEPAIRPAALRLALAPMLRPLVPTRRLGKLSGQFLSRPRGQATSSEPRLCLGRAEENSCSSRPRWVAYRPFPTPPFLFNELPLMVISSPPLVPSRATPDTKFPRPATEEQTDCHREPSCVFSTAYAGTFLLP